MLDMRIEQCGVQIGALVACKIEGVDEPGDLDGGLLEFGDFSFGEFDVFHLKRPRRVCCRETTISEIADFARGNAEALYNYGK